MEINKTTFDYKILDLPNSQRDRQWEASFLDQFPVAKAQVLHPQPQQGPDNFPYLLIETKNSADAEPVSDILDWLSGKGIGLVVNPRKPSPDYVFTYGMIVNNKMYGHFLYGTIDPQKEFKIGSPEEHFFPTTLRQLLKEFLQQQGVITPKILISSSAKNKLEVCFSLESLGSPKEKEHNGILEAISWFLPPHYSLAIASEKSLPQFSPL